MSSAVTDNYCWGLTAETTIFQSCLAVSQKTVEIEDRWKIKKKYSPLILQLLQAQQDLALLYAKVAGSPSTGSYPAPSPSPTTQGFMSQATIIVMLKLSVNLTTLFLDRLPKWLTSTVHIFSPVTDNCPTWISGRDRMAMEMISWPISTKERCPTWRSNPRIEPTTIHMPGRCASDRATEPDWGQRSWNKTIIYPSLLEHRIWRYEHSISYSLRVMNSKSRLTLSKCWWINRQKVGHLYCAMLKKAQQQGEVNKRQQNTQLGNKWDTRMGVRKGKTFITEFINCIANQFIPHVTKITLFRKYHHIYGSMHTYNK